MNGTSFAPQQSMGYPNPGFQTQQFQQPLARRPMPAPPVAPVVTAPVVLKKEVTELLSKAAKVIFLKCQDTIKSEMALSAELSAKGEVHNCPVSTVIDSSSGQNKKITIRKMDLPQKNALKDLQELNDPYKIEAFTFLLNKVVETVEQAFRNNSQGCVLFLMRELNFTETWVKDQNATHLALTNSKFLQIEAATIALKIPRPK